MDSWSELVYVVLTAAGWLLAAASFFLKLRWANEFAKAKDEIIRAKEAEAKTKDGLVSVKDAHIALLEREIRSLKEKELSPIKLRDSFLAVRAQLEKYNEELVAAVAIVQSKLDDKERQLTEMQAQESEARARVQQLETERTKLAQRGAALKKEAMQYSEADKEMPEHSKVHSNKLKMEFAETKSELDETDRHLAELRGKESIVRAKVQELQSERTKLTELQAALKKEAVQYSEAEKEAPKGLLASSTADAFERDLLEWTHQAEKRNRELRNLMDGLPWRLRSEISEGVRWHVGCH